MRTLNRYSSQRYAAFSNEVKAISMRFSAIRAVALATVATTALAACANQSRMVPSSPSAMAPTAARISPLELKTCASTPPQYEWIFEGACQKFHLTSTGGRFSLGDYQGITVKGLVGKNTAKGRVKFALADAIDQNGDIKTYKGIAFPPYRANGITYVYFSGVNQSTEVIKMITVRGQPALQYTITNAKGFGDADVCGVAVLTFKDGKAGKAVWKALPASGKVKGNKVTIRQYGAPAGFELLPKIPVYFATNCYMKQ